MPAGRSIAVCQTIPVRGDVAGNLEEHVRLVQMAADEGVSIALFPELSLTGYEMDLADALAFAPDDARLAPLVEAARRWSLTVVAGAPIALEARVHIGAFIIPPDGAIAIYTKHHLGAFSARASCDGVVPPPEAAFFAPGDMNPLVEVDGHAVAVAICADTGRPSHPRAAAERGATMYLASMFVIPSEFERETAHLKQYAREHRMAVAFANYGGPTGGLAAAGRSAIWSDAGELVAQLEAHGPGLAIATESAAGWQGRTVMVTRPRVRSDEQE